MSTDRSLAAASPRSTTWLIECFAATPGEADAIARSARLLAAERPSDGDLIDYVAAIAIAVDEQILLILRGPDAETIRTACRRSGLPVERVIEVDITDVESRWQPPLQDRRPLRAPDFRR